MQNRTLALLLSFLLANNVVNAAENVKQDKKSYSPNVLKIVSGVACIAIISGGAIIYYDNVENNPDKSLKDWEKDILLLNASRTYVYSQIISKNLNGKEVDEDGYEFKCSSSQSFVKQEGITKKPEVVDVYNAICKLYVELSNNEKVKKMRFKPDLYPNPHYSIDEIRGRRVISSLVAFVATPWYANQNDVLKWNIKTDFNGVSLISCNMPDGKYEYITEIKDDYNQVVKYKATFKKGNGKLNFEKIEFLN